MKQEVRITAIHDTTPEVRCFVLKPMTGTAEQSEPGAHIDVHLPNGLIWQYSLTNGPSDTSDYQIAVKKEVTGRGGSQAMHGLNVGDMLSVAAARNNFCLEPGRAIFLAGGIGITPLLSMARNLVAQGESFHFHLFARSQEFAPFKDEIDLMNVGIMHLGLVPPALNETLETILANPDTDTHLYMCGPAAFMDVVTETSKSLGWADSQVHLEHFALDPDNVDTQGDTFEVVLAKSGLTLEVSKDQTILEALEDVGIEIETSCESGICGTCVTPVLEGVVDHRDMYLTDLEKADGKIICVCVSKAQSRRLVLDI